MATTTEIVPTGGVDLNVITMNGSVIFDVTLPPVVDSSFSLGSAVDFRTDWNLVVADNTIDISDSISFNINANDTVASDLSFSESVFLFCPVTLADSLSFSDSVKLFIYPPALSSVVTMNGSVSDQRIALDTVISTMGLDGAVSMVSTFNITVQDTLSWIDQVILSILGSAWTVPTDTFAMSRFDPFSYNSMALVNGYLLAVGDSGLYQVGAGTEAVTAILTGGLSDFGSRELKRPRDCWIEYQGNPPSVSLDKGDDSNSIYTVENAATTTRPTTSRAKLGRGLQARHWRVTLRGDGTIMNSQMQFDLVPTRR